MSTQSIACTTTLKGNTEEIYGVYDIVELSFKLAQPVSGNFFFCVNLSDEASYLYRDDVKVDGDTFTIETDSNVLDAMKDFADSGREYIPMAFQLETDSEHIHDKVMLQNPWFS